MTSLKQKAYTGAKWTTVATIITTLLQIGQLVVLARLLRPEDYGLMAMVGIVIGFAQAYADLGVSAAIIHRQDVNREQLASLYWLNIIVGAVIFIVLFSITPLVAILFKEPRLSELLPVVALGMLITPLGIQFKVLLEKELKFNLLAAQDVITVTCGATVAIGSAYLGQGVWSLVWGQLTTVTVSTMLLFMVGWKHWKPMLHFNKSDLSGYLSFGLYQMGERTLNYFNYKIDQILVGTILGTQALGYYNFAFKLVVEPTMKINPIITRVAFPVFSLVQDEIPRLRRGYIEVMHVLSIINAPLLLGIGVIAPTAVPILFGAQWNSAVVLVQLLSIFAFVRSTGNPVGSLLLARGRADLSFTWNLALLIAVAPTVWIGARIGGTPGVAIALLCMQIILIYPAYMFLIRKMIGPCVREYFSSIFKPLFLAVAMAVGVWIVSMFGYKSVMWLAIEIVDGVVIYIGLVYLFDREVMNFTKSLNISFLKSKGRIENEKL